MKSNNYDKGKNKIESLMGLRFLFALGIFFHHFDTFSDMNIPGYYDYSKYWFEGFVGVNFFYILSGFIIAYCYTNKLKDGTVKAGEFLYKRFARLWPVHILTLFIALISYSSIRAIFSKAGLLTVAMLQSYVPIEGYAFNFNGVYLQRCFFI